MGKEFNLRLNPDFKQKLTEEAKVNNRSLHGEILNRLEKNDKVVAVRDGITTEYSGKHMICTYSPDYKSVTNKATGYTQLFFKGNLIREDENQTLDEFCAMQEYVINRIAESK